MSTFTCESCKNTFEAPEDNEAAALEELKKEFPHLDPSDGDVAQVCETCFQKIKHAQALMSIAENIEPIKFEFGEKVLLQGIVLRELATIGKRFEEETLSQYQIDMMTHVGNTLKGIAEKFAAGGEIAAVEKQFEELSATQSVPKHLH
jgi:hypothetical protein